MEDKNKEEVEVNETIDETTNENVESENPETAEENNSEEDIKQEEKSETEILAEKLQDLQDKHLRLTAEFDNYRKRTLKEKSELIKTGGESVLINMLPIIDDMGRAMESVKKAQDVEAVKEGMELISSKFEAFISQNGIKEIETKEKDFDTDLHEAIAKVPAPSEELKGKVIDVVQKGYMLHDKIVRHAKVVVGE